MKKLLTVSMLVLFLFPSITIAKRISFLVVDANTCLLNKAIKDLSLPEGIEVRFFIHKDMRDDTQAQEFVSSSEVIIVDVMMKEMSEYLVTNVDFANKRVYAVRGSRDDETLEKQGFIFDPAVKAYYQYMTVKNIQNLVYRVVNKAFDPSFPYEEPERLPELRIYHPDNKEAFTCYEDYLKWYEKRSGYVKKAPWVGIMAFSSMLMEGQTESMDYLIKQLEKQGFNVIPAFGRDLKILTQIFLDEKRKSRVDLVLAYTLKFYSSINDKVRAAIKALDVPMVNAIHLYGSTIEEWAKDPKGLLPMDVMWNIANPEISGIIEPTPLSGKKEMVDAESGRHYFVHRPVEETIDLLIPRLKKWVALRQKANEKKRVAILYYNHSQGKQNIGASYLNVFKSLDLILNRMKNEGYQVKADQQISENAVKDLILKYGRNIGSWAPGELDRMLREEKVIRLPVSTYRKWFDDLPEDFKTKVISQWGRAEASNIMIKDGHFIIPAVLLGNVMVMPEPSRGWGDEPMKLYHDPTLYPHHQYIAAYLWLKHVFKADAMIHLGTHATHEWLPGKQAGLSASCPPDVLITDIPNIYPYIVDDVGEGIQAKRRGRGVIIDHMIPPLKESELYHEYAQIYDLISSYSRSTSVASKTTGLKLKKIIDLVKKTGIDKDLGITEFDEEGLEEIEHYLLEIRENFMPYGLHTFGRAYEGEALEETVNCIVKRNTGFDKDQARKKVYDSGRREIDNLIKGLNGGYIPSGEGNDPIRNPAAVPTGKNFYGFNPAKVPSKIAWELGKKAAQEIIDKHIKEKKSYPDKVAVVLWATETIRNEGVNECTILYLMGLKPKWDRSDRVTGTQVIPGRELKRPRIDVLINPSGLYRDLFPNMLDFLDKAVQKAAAQQDIENLIRKHNEQIKTRLIKSGMDEKEADVFSRIRIFTEKPGSYGTGVAEMTGASGFWESDDEIVNVYENRVGYAFGLGKWGEPAKEVFKENLKGVKIAVHSVSSSLYGTMDNDDVFQYLGGLSLAVKKESGEAPDTMVSMQRIPNRIEVEDIAKTIGRELRTRYLNPKWIEGMKKEDYAGAREMAHFVEYMWGWQVTTPQAVDKNKWQETYEVYVEDKYGMEIKEFFNKANPWAYQSISARMLEAVRKGYWKAEEKVKKKLAVEYAVSVVEKGVACCDHTCNNPVLNQMVVNIISLPGVMSPEMVEKFKMAVEQAAGKSLEKQVKNRKKLQKKLNEGFDKTTRIDEQKMSDPKSKKEIQKDDTQKGPESQTVEGYRMEEMKPKDETTDLASSGVQWFASLFVMLIIGLFVYGVKKNNLK